MNPNELDKYLELIIKPALEEYAKVNNRTPEELMLNLITIEDTGLFNYKGKQNTVYNRFHDSNIKTLKDLFLAHQNNTINYGKNNNPSNDNYYIHNEIDGIISLLKYKYLRVYPDNLQELLNYQINFNFKLHISPYSDYGYPGNVIQNKNDIRNKEYIDSINSFYKILKSCGFNQTQTKTLIDIAYGEKIENITLSEFLSTLSIDKIKEKLKKVPQELNPFLNILNIIKDFQEEYKLLNNQNKSIR